MTRLDAEYVLPLRWSDDAGLDELTTYLGGLGRWIDVTVVDGSVPERFAVHRHVWAGMLRHVAVDPLPGANGKVRGVLTGLRLARHAHVVVADDDVRYDESGLRAVVAGLERADLVVPQNHFSPHPWHARWDTARSLLNRALGSDYPGTYGLRAATLRAAGGYDADVLFENLELERTVRAVGGRVARRPDILVARRPPSARHFLSQRVRQAYDSFAQPARLLAELSILPAAVVLARRRMLPLALAATIAVAEVGRRRAGGAAVFPRSAALWTPLWLAERGVAVWVAVAYRWRGGIPYAGSRLRRAATPPRVLRRRHRSDARAGEERARETRTRPVLSSPPGRSGAP